MRIAFLVIALALTTTFHAQDNAKIEELKREVSMAVAGKLMQGRPKLVVS